MAFRLSKKANQWFKYIQKGNGFEIDFDSYYFCLIAGLTKGQPLSFTNAETTDVIQQFPKEYQPNRYLIIALFLNVELKRLGISLEERTTLNKKLTELINPISATGLSDDGMKALNSYAFRGFHELQTHFPEPPRSLDGFLVGYYQFLNG